MDILTFLPIHNSWVAVWKIMRWQMVKWLKA